MFYGKYDRVLLKLSELICQDKNLNEDAFKKFNDGKYSSRYGVLNFIKEEDLLHYFFQPSVYEVYTVRPLVHPMNFIIQENPALPVIARFGELKAKEIFLGILGNKRADFVQEVRKFRKKG